MARGKNGALNGGLELTHEQEDEKGVNVKNAHYRL